MIRIYFFLILAIFICVIDTALVSNLSACDIASETDYSDEEEEGDQESDSDDDEE